MAEQVKEPWPRMPDTPGDLECPICRIYEAVQGQQLPVALDLFKAITKVRCQCQGHNHHPLVAHPHAPQGCRGYGKVRPL